MVNHCKDVRPYSCYSQTKIDTGENRGVIFIPFKFMDHPKVHGVQVKKFLSRSYSYFKAYFK